MSISSAPFECTLCQEPESFPVLHISGVLDNRISAEDWNKALETLSCLGGDQGRDSLILNLEKISHLDTAGAILIVKLKEAAHARGIKQVIIRGPGSEFANVLERASHGFDTEPKSLLLSLPLSHTERIGKRLKDFWLDFHEFVSFFGEIVSGFGHCIVHPGRLRIYDTLLVAERAGVDALPIVALIAFIVGLVMAFQAAIPMKMFGVEIYVANLIGIAMVRELGPLMTAIVLAGRSASAFAAEIGTMKINEEIDALGTMGIDPVAFLIVPRIAAAVVLTPLLALFANLVGILGGAVVILSLGYPMITYYNQVVDFVSWVDFTGGLVKCFVFGMLIAATGCIRGYQTGQGASAVGIATTSAVVTSIILIAVSDGIFSIVYYRLGI